MPSIPKPFKRPSIEVPSTAVKKEWRSVPLSSLAVGDLIAEFGLVREITQGQYVVVVTSSGRTFSTESTQSVFAFVPVV